MLADPIHTDPDLFATAHWPAGEGTFQFTLDPSAAATATVPITQVWDVTIPGTTFPPPPGPYFGDPVQVPVWPNVQPWRIGDPIYPYPAIPPYIGDPPPGTPWMPQPQPWQQGGAVTITTTTNGTLPAPRRRKRTRPGKHSTVVRLSKELP